MIIDCSRCSKSRLVAVSVPVLRGYNEFDRSQWNFDAKGLKFHNSIEPPPPPLTAPISGNGDGEVCPQRELFPARAVEGAAGEGTAVATPNPEASPPAKAARGCAKQGAAAPLSVVTDPRALVGRSFSR